MSNWTTVQVRYSTLLLGTYCSNCPCAIGAASMVGCWNSQRKGEKTTDNFPINLFFWGGLFFPLLLFGFSRKHTHTRESCRDREGHQDENICAQQTRIPLLFLSELQQRGPPRTHSSFPPPKNTLKISAQFNPRGNLGNDFE